MVGKNRELDFRQPFCDTRRHYCHLAASGLLLRCFFYRLAAGNIISPARFAVSSIQRDGGGSGWGFYFTAGAGYRVVGLVISFLYARHHQRFRQYSSVFGENRGD